MSSALNAPVSLLVSAGPWHCRVRGRRPFRSGLWRVVRTLSNGRGAQSKRLSLDGAYGGVIDNGGGSIPPSRRRTWRDGVRLPGMPAGRFLFGSTEKSRHCTFPEAILLTWRPPPDALLGLVWPNRSGPWFRPIDGSPSILCWLLRMEATHPLPRRPGWHAFSSTRGNPLAGCLVHGPSNFLA